MNKPNILLIGAGGHAHACIDVIEQQGVYNIAGLINSTESMHSRRLGYIVLATDDDLPNLVYDNPYALICVGQIQSPENRIRLFLRVIKLGFQLPVIVSPSAYVSRHANIGPGTIVMHGAIINASAKVGANCIINSCALIEHDAIVEDHCHISTGAILNGGVSVGPGSFIGSGSIIKEGVTLGKGCVVGMGLSVRHTQADQTLFVGKDKS